MTVGDSHLPYAGAMRAAFVEAANPADPLAALVVGERPDPPPGDGWVNVRVRAASVNHHDVWSLRGVGLPAERMPMILGTDAVGTTADGREVAISVPAGSSSGRKLRLRGLGLPRRDGSRGDWIVELVIVVPSSLTAEERRLYEELARLDTPPQ